MNSKKKTLLIIGFILFDILLIIGLFFLFQMTMLNRLKVEVHELSELDIMKDRYNRKYKTIGEYRIVEKAIKEYLDDYAVHIQELSKLVEEPQLNSILSIDNITSDSPNFEESLKYIEQFLTDYNSKLDYLLKKLNEDTIKNAINDYTKNPYYRNLYVELMLEDNMREDFFGTKEILMATKTKVNELCNGTKDILIFLRDHPDAWFIEDGQIKFRESGDFDYYNQLLSRVNN